MASGRLAAAVLGALLAISVAPSNARAHSWTPKEISSSYADLPDPQHTIYTSWSTYTLAQWDSIGMASYELHRSTVSGFVATPGAATRVYTGLYNYNGNFKSTGLSPCTWYYFVLVQIATDGHHVVSAQRAAQTNCAVVDSGTPDTGTLDTGTPDTGTPDTGTPDTGTPDTGTSVDSAATDTGSSTDSAALDARVDGSRPNQFDASEDDSAEVSDDAALDDDVDAKGDARIAPAAERPDGSAGDTGSCGCAVPGAHRPLELGGALVAVVALAAVRARRSTRRA